MKTIFFVFCLLITNTFSLFAQNPYEWIRQIEDSSSFTAAPEHGSAIPRITDIAIANGAVYVVGYTDRIDLQKKFIHFMKYSTDGTLIWRKEIQNINSSWTPYMELVVLKGEIIIYGVLDGTIITNQTTYNIIGTSSFAVKYDSAGNEIWLKGFPLVQMRNISVFADSLLIFGLVRYFAVNGILTSDKDINFLADSLVINNTAASLSYFLFDVDNHSYYQYGSTSDSFSYPNNSVFTSQGGKDGYIIKNSLIDSSLIYIKQLQGVANEYISQLQLDSQGNLYVVATSSCYQCNVTASIDGFTMQSNSSYIIKIAPNGTVLWVKDYFSLVGGAAAHAMRNDELVIGGAYRSSTGNAYCAVPSYPEDWMRSPNDDPMCGYAGTVIHRNANDGSKPGFRMGGNYYDAVTALAIDNDGALYFTLSSNSDTIYFDGDSQHFFKENGAIFLAKMYPWAITSTENEQVKSAAFHVFPNPCADFFTIDTALPYDYMEITNVLGEAVYQTNISAPQYISTKDLAKGLYFVTLYHKNQTLGRQKLLVQ